MHNHTPTTSLKILRIKNTILVLVVGPQASFFLTFKKTQMTQGSF